MGIFVVSQAERWHRTYEIKAETMEEAQEIYKKYVETQNDPEDNISISDPEYLNDIEDDVEWYDKGEHVVRY